MHIEYLLPYSPDLNPIEQLFVQLKVWMRIYKDLVYEYDNFLEFITLSLDYFQQSGDPEAHFRDAGIEYERQVVEE